jgi:RND family efflux transporter MFP subunit
MRRKLVLLLTILMLAVVTAGCSTRADATAEAKPKKETARTVAVAQVTRQDLARSLELAAEFRPYQEIELHSKVSGYLRAIHVDVGDRVRRGQLIAELEAPEMAQEVAHAVATWKRTQLEVERARSELQRSEANFRIRQISFDRLSGVMKARPNLIAQQEIDDYAARFREAQAEVAATTAALAAAEQQVQVAAATREKIDTLVSYLRITAPFSGVVTRRLVDPGAMIQAGTASHVAAMPVVTLSETDRLRLVLPAPESIVARVRVGSPVEVRVESLRRVFQGRVSRFSGKLDSSTRTMETEVDIPNSEYAIKPGMFGYARLVLDTRLETLAIPVQALAGHGADATVLVVGKDKRLEQRPVGVGMETPNYVEVLSGLREHDMVVVGARASLRPGMSVEPKLIADSSALNHH